MLGQDKLDEIQKYLKEEKLDGWLLADFHARNTIAVEFLNLSAHLTRRWFYFIPAEGEPVGLIHNIEEDRFRSVPGEKIYFSSYNELEEQLPGILKGAGRIAMEYSPRNRLPYIGLVDAGTIELVRQTGVEIVPSSDIVAAFQARLSWKQVELHKEAAVLVNGIKDDAFKLIREYLERKQSINERIVVDFILKRFGQENMITDFPPNCSVDGNISKPHYDPTAEKPSEIKVGSLVLIDLWAKLNRPHAVYADITWIGFVGEKVPDKYAEEFEIVTEARDQAIKTLWDKNSKGAVYGYEIDDACRAIITKAGYGEYFFHRTGHSILESVHGPGPNIDNLETEDRRKILPGHLFSIEPGIYLENYGFRSEVDVLMTEGGPDVTTQPIQQEIIPLLK